MKLLVLYVEVSICSWTAFASVLTLEILWLSPQADVCLAYKPRILSQIIEPSLWDDELCLRKHICDNHFQQSIELEALSNIAMKVHPCLTACS